MGLWRGSVTRQSLSFLAAPCGGDSIAKTLEVFSGTGKGGRVVEDSQKPERLVGWDPSAL